MKQIENTWVLSGMAIWFYWLILPDVLFHNPVDFCFELSGNFAGLNYLPQVVGIYGDSID